MNVCEMNSESVMVITERRRSHMFLKKRADLWGNEVLKNDASKAVLNALPDCGDRFIPKRFNRFSYEINSKFMEDNEVEDIITSNIHRNYWRQNSFITVLNYTFGIQKRRLLDFSHMPARQIRRSESTIEHLMRLRNGIDWPCRPRSKPLAFTDATHDLPDLDAFIDSNLMDWSSNDQIAVSFGQDIMIWKSVDDVTMIFAMKSPRSIAYSPNGKYLAIGCMDGDYPVLELWKVNSNKDFIVAGTKFFQTSNRAVCCIQWSNSGSEIVCGTSAGNVYVLSITDLKRIHKFDNHKRPITIMRFSPTKRYLACGDSEGNVTIYAWGSYQVCFVVRSKLRVRVTFDWHPWNGVDLAISETVPASIVILHVPSQKIAAFYQRSDDRLIIYSINFSKVTGELLVNVFKKDNLNCVSFVVLVMSSLNRVVDVLEMPQSGVRFLKWSPDGLRLITAGLDESLSIWNFYPGYKRHRKIQTVHYIADNIDRHSKFMKWATIK